MSIYGSYESTLHQILQELMLRFKDANKLHAQKTGQSLFEHLNGRIKSEKSMVEKCHRKKLPVNTHSALRVITDAIGLRIVTNFIDDIYACIGLIEKMPDVKIVKRKDYITNAKPNGYRSYHLILDKMELADDPEGRNPGHFYVEVQLRTIAMDTWAALEHEIKYKHKIKNPEMISKELKNVADDLASCDVRMQTIRQLIKEDKQ